MYLLDFGREIIIFILLLYLFERTEIKELNILIILVFMIHVYKIYNNFDKIKNFTIKHINLSIILFLLMIYSLFLFINGYELLFLLLFILSRIIMTKVSNYERISPKISKNYNLLTIILLMIIYFNYSDYRYRNIFLMDAINHFLLFIDV